MSGSDLIIASRRVVLPGGIRPATVTVRGGVITGIADGIARGALDVGEQCLMPGLVDTHVHVNEPGRTEWEGFATATAAAAAGGVTTIVDMPLNASPVTTDLPALERKMAAAAGQCRVDCGFWGGIVPANAGRADRIDALLRGGVLGFKCFMAPSGIDEFPHVGEADLRRALPLLAERGAVLLVHAEHPALLGAAEGRSYRGYLASRPPAAEVRAIEVLVALVRRFAAAVHVVHLSTAEALPLLESARAEGRPLTVETCPHYLCLAAEEIVDGATLFKCAPPIREGANREGLWSALQEGLIDLIASDHSPCPAALKAPESGDFGRAWGGIASLELGLPVVFTAARGRGIGLERLAHWMAAAPAALAGLKGRKGTIEVGADGDLIVFEEDVSSTVDPARLHHRHRQTPYTGTKIDGRVRQTYLRGQLVYEWGRGGGEFPSVPSGRFVTRHGSSDG